MIMAGGCRCDTLPVRTGSCRGAPPCRCDGREHEHQDGVPAFPFELKDHEGNLHRLEDFQGNWLLMVYHRHLG